MKKPAMIPNIVPIDDIDKFKSEKEPPILYFYTKEQVKELLKNAFQVVPKRFSNTAIKFIPIPKSEGYLAFGVEELEEKPHPDEDGLDEIEGAIEESKKMPKNNCEKYRNRHIIMCEGSCEFGDCHPVFWGESYGIIFYDCVCLDDPNSPVEIIWEYEMKPLPTNL